jgi:hypothetical protein
MSGGMDAASKAGLKIGATFLSQFTDQLGDAFREFGPS